MIKKYEVLLYSNKLMINHVIFFYDIQNFIVIVWNVC